MGRTISVLLFLLAVSTGPQALAWGGHRERRGAPQTFPRADALPNPRLTPGAIDPRVTQNDLGRTICRRGGYTRSVRPQEAYTEALKRAQIREYGYSDRRLGDYEEDHLVSLELGGSPDSPRNLWPEPHSVQGGWGSYAKDRLEDVLHRRVCAHRMSLRRAQSDIAHDWIAAYRKYMRAVPNPRPMRWQRHERRTHW